MGSLPCEPFAHTFLSQEALNIWPCQSLRQLCATPLKPLTASERGQEFNSISSASRAFFCRDTLCRSFSLSPGRLLPCLLWGCTVRPSDLHEHPIYHQTCGIRVAEVLVGPFQLTSVPKSPAHKVLTGVKCRVDQKQFSAFSWKGYVLLTAWAFHVFLMLGKPDVNVTRTTRSTDNLTTSCSRSCKSIKINWSSWGVVVEPLFSTQCAVQIVLQLVAMRKRCNPFFPLICRVLLIFF